MISKWQWLWRQLTHTLWIRSALFALLGVLAALLALTANLFLPKTFLPLHIGADAVDSVLNIIASSMLAVTTFSLSVMVTAYQAASSQVTPRATQLLIQDTTSQNVLGTFIGSFLYALVGIIALSTDAYGEAGRFFLFIVTLVVIVLIVVALLRWISHLTQFGRMPDSCGRVEKAAADAIQHRLASPYLGGVCANQEPFKSKFVLSGEVTGYVQHVDLPQLQEIAEAENCVFRLNLLPGKFITPLDTLLYADKDMDEQSREKLLNAFLVKDTRSYEQDPRFGFVVLAEIASRALSPAVNDPGTAIDIIGRNLRLLQLYRQPEPQDQRPPCPRIEVPPLDIEDIVNDAFAPIIRDAAAIVEVRIRLHKAIRQLQSALGDEWQTALADLQDYAAHYAKQHLNEPDLARLQRLE